jgi:hypothetical protein
MAATVNLRTFPDSKEVYCPHCGHSITLFDPDGSEYVVCSSCHSYCRFIGPTRHLQTQQPISPIKNTPILPIGQTGTLKGTPYKVIGYMEKKEVGTHYEWREYMLYSFTKGYAFLAEYDGHWSFIAGKAHYPELEKALLEENAAEMDGVQYIQYNSYLPVITALAGEFDWDAYEERVLTHEFINPPYILIREKNKTNEHIVDWYFGEYIEPEEIAEGLNVPLDTFPAMIDIGANQPNPYKKRFEQVLRISLLAAALIIFIQIIFGCTKQTQQIMNRTVTLTLPPPPKIDSLKHDTGINALANHLRQDSSANTAVNYNQNGNYEYQPLRTSVFNIAHGPADVEIEMNVPVDNNWFEGTVEIVNEKNNQTWDVSREIEYYHGYEDGESWSEGSTSADVVVNDVPEGTYHLNIYPYAGTQALDSAGIKVTANVILWQNILISILLLCLAPLAYWYFKRQFEVNRWMNSDYSPYKKAGSND